MPNDTPLTDAQAKRLIQMYDEAEKEILREVNRLLLKSPESYSLAWQRTILARVQQIRGGLLSGSRKWCEEAIKESYMDGVDWADKDPLSGKQVMGGFGSIHQQAVDVLAENSYNRLADVNGVIGRRTDDIFREVALSNVKGSVIGYQTTRQAARRIREDLATRGITGFVDKAGRSWNMSRYARVVAQETTNQAFRAGTINRLQQKGHDLVRCSGHSGACKKCQQWEGKTLSMSGGDTEYPSVDEARANGLFHVGCLHVISLAPEERDKAIARLKGSGRDAEIKRLAEKGGWKAPKKPTKEFKVSKPQNKEQPTEPKAAGPAAGKVFIPAKTTKEANKRLTEILTRGNDQWNKRQQTYNIIPDHRFKQYKATLIGKPRKMSLDLANAVLEKFEEFEGRCDKLGIPMLRGMGPAPSNASMSMGDGILGFDLKLQERRITETVANKITRLESSISDYDRRIESAKATLQNNPGYEPNKKWLEDLQKNKEYEIKKLTSLKERKKFDWYKENPGQIPFVSNELYLEGKQKVLNDLEHEFGHHIHQQLDVTNPRDFRYPPLEQELYRTATVAEKDAMKTRYGKSNSAEWFAENYALYMTGHKDLLTDTALNLVKRIDMRQSQ